jgi:hypothetical protein
MYIRLDCFIFEVHGNNNEHACASRDVNLTTIRSHTRVSKGNPGHKKMALASAKWGTEFRMGWPVVVLLESITQVALVTGT